MVQFAFPKAAISLDLLVSRYIRGHPIYRGIELR
jgi:hypothetical protein